MDLAALTAKVQEGLSSSSGFTDKVKFDFGDTGKLLIDGASGKATNEDGAADATIRSISTTSSKWPRERSTP